MPDTSEVGRRLAAAREAKGLTQADVADAIGLKHGVQISRWEKGGHLPASDTLGRLAELYGVSVEWLLSGKGEAPVNNSVSRGTPDSHGEPTSPEQAIRKVKAIAARLEADLHDWGASTSTFDAMRIALATEDNIRMFRDGFIERPGDIPTVFRRYALFAEALRETLRDRVEKLAESGEPE